MSREIFFETHLENVTIFQSHFLFQFSTAPNHRQVAKYRSAASESDVEKKMEKFEISNGISEPEN